MYDTLIIGAGLSGLAAGIRLAHYDQRVCILERHSTIGGLNSFYRQGGRHFDVGLHAITNYAPKGVRRGPLARMLRQLRFTWDELALAPQIGSMISFPGVSLRFTNDFALFQSEVNRHFPRQKDNFQRLVNQLADYDHVNEAHTKTSAREVVRSYITDPLLVEMLFCPLLFYGSAKQRDVDFQQFSILFRSIFQEGFARPYNGIRMILTNLVRKFKQLGGELRLRTGVNRIISRQGMAEKVLLDDGTELTARRILSSAGLHETLRLCADGQVPDPQTAGQISFIESISVLNAQPRSLGLDRTIVFFNDSEAFQYDKPDELADVHSGVICCPNNYYYDTPLSDNIVRITALANYDRWAALSPEAYQLAKLRWYDRTVASAVRYVPDFRSAVIATALFTPLPIRRFTGHENGAVYGSPDKRYDGTTHLKNLFLCGTDQGFVGIIGAILSGITIANRHFLQGAAE